MFRFSSLRLGGAVTRSAAAAGAKRPKKKVSPPKRAASRRAASPAKAGKATKAAEATTKATVTSSGRPAYMTEKREKEVLAMSERMQQRDISGEIPVASFAFDILKAHPSVRDMGLRERMDFLCTRWAKLPAKKRMEYLNDPLKGLM